MLTIPVDIRPYPTATSRVTGRAWPGRRVRSRLAGAAAVWVARPGLVTLGPSRPGFPWPSPGDFIRHVVRSLARVSAR